MDLPFDDGSVAGYRADKVLHALDEPLDALVQARRVLEPGGRIVLVGQDWDTIVVDSGRPELTRRIVRARAATIPSPLAARGYRNLLLDAGFVDPVVEVHTGVFTGAPVLPVIAGLAATKAATESATGAEPADEWLAEQRERAARDRLFVAIPMVVVAARR